MSGVNNSEQAPMLIWLDKNEVYVGKYVAKTEDMVMIDKYCWNDNKHYDHWGYGIELERLIGFVADKNIIYVSFYPSNERCMVKFSDIIRNDIKFVSGVDRE
jgi:hypothetical protein